MSNSGTVQTVVAVLAGIAVVVWLHISVFSGYAKADINDNSYDKSLEKLEKTNLSDDVIQQSIKSLNSTCPRQVDAETRLDSATYLPGNVFAEYFTLLNTERASIDTSSVKPRIISSILSSLKTNSAYSSFKSVGITFAFIYKDKAQEPLFTIAITPSEYNN